ncbi:MAG: HAMP domain-containing sensor histidine kinase [bacterium]
MKWHFLSLVLLLTVAAVILTGGSRLAHREQQVRVERDRESLRAFSVLMQAELRRLETLYENYLRRITREIPSDDAFEVRRASDWLLGVQQISVLSTNQYERSASPLSREKDEDRHFTISNPDGQRFLKPALFQPKDKFTAGQWIVMPEEVMNAAVYESGWVERPGNPVCFWYRRLAEKRAPKKNVQDQRVEQCVVIMVDCAVVADSMNRWMTWWVSENFRRVDAGTGGDLVEGPRNSVLAVNGQLPRNKKQQPDFVFTTPSRFGSWQLLSWDGWETRMHYHNPTLAASAVLSLLVAILGMGIFFQQVRAARLAEQRVSFINRVSHELRSPLTNILLNVDLAAEVIEDHGALKEAEQRLMLVSEEGRRLGRMIDNVLTFSRQEQGRLRLKPRECVPSDVVRDVLTQFDAALKRHNMVVKVTGESADVCILDADALSQILVNLVSNVEKYASGGGLLDILVASRAGRLVIIVSDNGLGIPADQGERVFRPFYRLSDEVREGVTGTGLGLSIARDLAIQMGGTLRLLPVEKGASFELDIPAVPVCSETCGGLLV